MAGILEFEPFPVPKALSKNRVDELKGTEAREMKVAVIGANGQLGTDLCRMLTAQSVSVLPLTRREIDVSDAAQVDKVLGSIRADVVISTAAFHKVEECEKQAVPSFTVNAIGPRNLALACRQNNAALVHFSTDYVFDGISRRPYTETDLPRPLNVYGVSKLAGEHMLRLTWERHFVIRTCGLYGLAGSAGKGGNFVETMLKKAGEGAPIRVVNDQVLTPTFTGDLAEAVSKLIQTEAYGLYHASAEGECSWYEFARKIFELEKLKVDLRAVSSAEFSSPVQRPAYSVLSKQKLSQLGIAMKTWQEGLASYLAARSSARKVVNTTV
jgi:dTDP-4-dehydrorhamnose reductase